MDKTAFLRHIFSLLIFSSNGIMASYIDLPSYGIVFYRTVLAAFALLVSYLLVAKKRFTSLGHKKDALFIVISGIFQATEWLLMYESFKHIDVGIATLLTYLGPVIVIALSPFVFKESFSLRKLLAVTIVLIGVVCLNRGVGGSGNIKFGLLCAGLSAFCYAGMVICNKKSRQIVGMENVILQLSCCSLTAVIFTFITTRGHIPIPHPEISQWLLVIMLGITNTAFPCFLYFSTLAKLPAQVIAVSGYLEPLFAIIIAAVVLGQTLSLLQLLGCLMIIAGACWCILAKE